MVFKQINLNVYVIACRYCIWYFQSIRVDLSYFRWLASRYRTHLFPILRTISHHLFFPLRQLERQVEVTTLVVSSLLLLVRFSASPIWIRSYKNLALVLSWSVLRNLILFISFNTHVLSLNEVPCKWRLFGLVCKHHRLSAIVPCRSMETTQVERSDIGTYHFRYERILQLAIKTKVEHHFVGQHFI